MDNMQTTLRAKRGNATEIIRGLEEICRTQQLKRSGIVFPSHYFGHGEKGSINIYNVARPLKDAAAQEISTIIIGDGPIIEMLEKVYSKGEYEKIVSEYYEE